MATRGDAGNWKCPLCNKRFHSERDKDVHMTTDCKLQDPVEDKSKRRLSAVNLTRPSKNKLDKGSSLVTSYSLNSKTPVTMKWSLRAGEQISEREIYFFHKNGEMFTFTSEDAKGLGSASKGCFKCGCVMEVGEHEGSLNVGNLGVFEVTPFKVERRDPSYQVTIKLAGRDSELHNGTKPVQSSGNSRSQLSEGKGASNEKLKQAEAEVQRLKKENEVVKEKLKTAEDKNQNNIAKLKARIADRDKEMSHRNEELQNAQEELGRFSEKSQAILDRHGTDRSKLDESLQLIEDYRKKINEQKELISRLQKKVENNQNSNIQSNVEETALQRKLEKLRSENAALYTERDSMFAEIQHFKSENERLKHALTPNRSKSAQQSKKKYDESEEHIQLLSQRITDLEINVKKKDELIQRSQDLLPKCSLLEKELNQFKSGMSVGNVYESNVCTIREKERLLDITSRENQELRQRIEELEMNIIIEESERQTIVTDLKAVNKNLQRIISVRDAESDDLGREVTRLGSELSRAQRLLASELNSKKEFEGVGQDEDDSMLSMSQSLGPEFKRRSVVSSDFDETGRHKVRKQQSSSDVREIKELSKQVSERDTCVKELKTDLEFHRKENHSLKEKLNTSKRELEIVSNKLVQTEQNLSAVQTYLDEAHYMENEALNKTAEKNKDTSASPTTPATHKKDDKSTPKQPKYKYKDILFGRKYTKAYTLNQVEDPVGHLGGIVLCNRKTQYTTEYVAGTLQAIIPRRYSHEKTIAGIEFVDPLGDCDGDGHFKSKPKHALFIATDVVYIPCQDPK